MRKSSYNFPHFTLHDPSFIKCSQLNHLNMPWTYSLFSILAANFPVQVTITSPGLLENHYNSSPGSHFIPHLSILHSILSKCINLIIAFKILNCHWFFSKMVRTKFSFLWLMTLFLIWSRTPGGKLISIFQLISGCLSAPGFLLCFFLHLEYSLQHQLPLILSFLTWKSLPLRSLPWFIG